MENSRDDFVSAVVLAAGESRRMGDRNKLLLTVGDKPMIRRVVEAVCGSEAAEVIVVLGHDAEAVRSALHGLDVSFANNAAYLEGMSTSIHAGVQAASPEASGYMICLSDLPLIRSTEYSRLVRAFLAEHAIDDRAIVVPVFEGQRGNPVILSSHYKPAILAQQGVVGCRGLIKQHPDRVASVEMETDHILRDADTPEDYERLAAASGSSNS